MTRSNFYAVVAVSLFSVFQSPSSSGQNQPTAADSRSVAGFPGPVWPVDSNILYGGILRDQQKNIDLKGTTVREVLQAILTNIPGGNDSSAIPSGDFADLEVLHATKSRLVYTLDGSTSMIYNYAERSRDGRRLHFRKLVVMGLLYTLTVRWMSPSAKEVFHHFTVTRDRQRQFHIYGHTRTCQKYLGTSTGSCSADAKDCIKAERTNFEMLNSASAFDTGHLGADYLRYHCDLLPASKRRDQLDEEWLVFMSYNIWNFNSVEIFGDDYARRVYNLGRLFKQHMPAVLAFQEVRYDFEHGGILGHSQTRHLANLLPGYQYVFQPAMSYPRSVFGRVEEGVAVFSAYPILSHDYILLTRDPLDQGDNHQRILLHVEISTPQIGRIHVFVTHLSLSEAGRNRSVLEIWKFMEKFSGVRILAGDLNAEPHTAAIQFLAGKVDINGVWTKGLQDVWTMFYKEPRPDVPGTYEDFEERDIGLTFSTMEDNLVKRIDYVFVDLAHQAAMLNVTLAGTRGEEATSDHLGLVSTFTAK